MNDDLQKIKRYAEHAYGDEVEKVMHHEPCYNCPSVKNCAYLQKGRICNGIAKEILEHEISKMKE